MPWFFHDMNLPMPRKLAAVKPPALATAKFQVIPRCTTISGPLLRFPFDTPKMLP